MQKQAYNNTSAESIEGDLYSENMINDPEVIIDF